MASSIETLLSQGYDYVLLWEIEGIPWLFAERIPHRVDAESAPALPSTHYTDGGGVCAAAVWKPSQAISQEMDRETAIARGDAVDISLRWEAIEDQGLTTTLFRRPTTRHELAADLAWDATTATVGDNAGSVADDYRYIGRELVRVTGTVSDNQLTLTRSILGYPYSYEADSPSAYRFLTDRPEIWRGRFATLHLHVVSPEGRILDDTWTEGDYHEVRWLGFIDSQPQPDIFGIRLRALPLPRLASQELGYEIGAEVFVPDWTSDTAIGLVPVWVRPGGSLSIAIAYSGAASGTFTFRGPVFSSPRAMMIRDWVYALEDQLATALAAESWFAGRLNVGLGRHGGSFEPIPSGELTVEIDWSGASYNITAASLTVEAGAALYWLSPGTREPKFQGADYARMIWSDDWPVIDLRYPTGSYLPVVQTEGQGYQDLVLPSSGAGVIETDAGKELVRWDAVEDSDGVPPYDQIKLLRVAERGIGGTGPVSLGEGGELKVSAGVTATPGVALLTLLESSGTGDRGTYDSLGAGLGYGIPAAMIDEDSFLGIDLNEYTVTAMAEGRSSAEDLVGGWLALLGRCLIMRRDAAGDMKLTVARSEPLPIAIGVARLNKADVELSGIGVPDLVEGPNQVEVDRSGPTGEAPRIIVRDVPRIQAEGPRTLEVTAVGMPRSWGIQLAAGLIALGRGQAVIDVGVAPWKGLQIGDLVDVAIAHPALYDWASGARSPASVAGRILGDSWTPYDGRRRLTPLMSGLQADSLYLCPVLEVSAKLSSTEVRTTKDPALFLADDDVVRFYDIGEESTNMATRTVDAIGATGFTVKTALPAWVGAETRVTFGDLDEVAAGQAAGFMYQDATKEWGL